MAEVLLFKMIQDRGGSKGRVPHPEFPGTGFILTVEFCTLQSSTDKKITSKYSLFEITVLFSSEFSP